MGLRDLFTKLVAPTTKKVGNRCYIPLQKPDIDLMKPFGLFKTALCNIQEMRDNFEKEYEGRYK